MNASQRHAIKHEIDRRARLRPGFRNTDSYRNGVYMVFAWGEGKGIGGGGPRGPRPRRRDATGKYL